MPAHRTRNEHALRLAGVGLVAMVLVGCQATQDATAPGSSSSTDAPDDVAATATTAGPEPPARAGAIAVPPWQEATPPLTEEEEIYGTWQGEPVGEHGEWEIPDPRPTGVTFLELLGAPRVHRAGPDTLPVFDMADSGPIDQGGPDPVTGQTWSYWAEPVTDRVEDLVSPYGVDIQVTGWQQGREAIDLLRQDGLNDSWADTFELGEWAGHEDDEDRVAFRTYQLDAIRDDGGQPEPIDRYRGIVAIRTGDYLVGVSVTGDSADSADALSREIATKTAENLAVLDPEHGSD